MKKKKLRNGIGCYLFRLLDGTYATRVLNKYFSPITLNIVDMCNKRDDIICEMIQPKRIEECSESKTKYIQISHDIRTNLWLYMCLYASDQICCFCVYEFDCVTQILAWNGYSFYDGLLFFTGHSQIGQ